MLASTSVFNNKAKATEANQGFQSVTFTFFHFTVFIADALYFSRSDTKPTNSTNCE